MKIPRVKLTYTRPKKKPEFGPVTSSAIAARYARYCYDRATLDHRERFGVMLLSRCNEILGFDIISEGGISATVVDVKVIMQSALLANATAIICFHNHPSGNLKPSQPDIDISKRIKECCAMFDIVLMDSIILTSEGHTSLADEGILL